jgi:hypothetical protein
MRPSYYPSALAALLTLAAMIWMRQFSGDLTPANLPVGFKQAIIAFEFADASIIHQLFFQPDGQLKSTFVEYMKGLNHRDFALMTGYGLVLFFFAWRNRFGLGAYTVPALALAICAPIADAMENVQLLGILNQLPNETTIGSYLTMLKFFTWVKWLSLAIYPVLFVPGLVRSGLPGRLVAFVFVLSLFVALAALISNTPAQLSQFTTLVTAILGGIMVFCIYKVIRSML